LIEDYWIVLVSYSEGVILGYILILSYSELGIIAGSELLLT
jgi:hypothetical protein